MLELELEPELELELGLELELPAAGADESMGPMMLMGLMWGLMELMSLMGLV